MTTTPTAPSLGVRFVHVAQLLAAHLADHQLPEPASVQVVARAGESEVRAQVHSLTVPRVAVELLAWAETLTTVTAEVWRPPHGDGVHLSITSTLIGPGGTVELDVYGGAADDPVLFTDLAPGQRRDVPLGHLRTWAASATDIPGGGAAA
jgi:hypothetical protein